MSLQKHDGGAKGSGWIAIYITHNVQEAHIIVGKLRSYDIPAMIHQEAGAAAIGITLGNLGEIKVLVSPADYEGAAALLFSDESGQIEASNDEIQLIWPDEAEGAADDQDT